MSHNLWVIHLLRPHINLFLKFITQVIWLIVIGLRPLLNGQNGADEDFNNGWTFFLVTNHQIKCNKVSHNWWHCQTVSVSNLYDPLLRKNGKTVCGHLKQIWLESIKKLIALQQLFSFNLKIFMVMIRNRFEHPFLVAHIKWVKIQSV